MPAQGKEEPQARTSSGGGPGETVPQAFPGEIKDVAQRDPGTAIKNPPVIANFQLRPELINNVDSLRIIAEGSGGEGEVTFKYEWTKNGEPVGETNTFAGFKRGDKISVRVTPYDGRVYGASRTIATEIGNLNPKIAEHKEFLSTGNVFSYQVKATDPDGDTLTYSLTSAPQGMAIDQTKGVITWNVPAEYLGKASVTVSVTDGHGGVAFQTFSLDVKAESRRLRP